VASKMPPGRPSEFPVTENRIMRRDTNVGNHGTLSGCAATFHISRARILHAC
jgi:hypothetical protein